ncbi:MAG: diacylglycerol kinase family protein [Clostridiales bacterium]|nr:diacylglycerol kinase family protein [Clostridiales bacterium]
MKELGKSFVYAFKGIAYCIKNERNMRIHSVFAVYMFSYLLIYDFFEITRTQFAVLAMATGAVFAAEAINTAVENAVDLMETKYNKFCKAAKDAAAGAVLILAITSVAVGIIIMYQPEAFKKLFEYYRQKPLMLAVLILSVALSCVYIFGIKPDKKEQKGDLK